TSICAFLFTDIETSASMWERDSSYTSELIGLLNTVVTKNHGHVYRFTGDGVHTQFDSAVDALSAAVEMQHELASLQGDELQQFPVRIASGYGWAAGWSGYYYGSNINRLSHLLSIGHVGQVLISQAMFQQVQDVLPTEVQIQSLGKHQLKDLQEPEHVYQVN